MITELDTTVRLLPEPPDELDYAWRSIRREDVAAMYDMLLAIEKADDRQVVDTLADVEREFDDPWSNPATDSLAAFRDDGSMAGFARTFLNPVVEEEHRCFMWLEAHPDHRAGGLGEFLLDWAEARARQRLNAVGDDLPRLMRFGLQDTQTDWIALAERRGYARVRYFYRMRRDLREPIPDVTLPDGIALRNFTPDLSKRVQDALNEAFRDHWSAEAISDEDWQQFFLQRTTFRPDLTFVAIDGDQVAGVAFNTVSPEEIARRGVNEGWVAELAVRRAWRKRGIATALLCASMRAFESEGLDYATLGVDAENLSGALRLYERVGFRQVKRFIQFNQAVE